MTAEEITRERILMLPKGAGKVKNLSTDKMNYLLINLSQDNENYSKTEYHVIKN